MNTISKTPLLVTAFAFFLISYAIMPAVSFYSSTVLRLLSVIVVAFWIVSAYGFSVVLKNFRRLLPVYSIIILDLIFVWGKNNQYLMDAIYSDGNIFFISLMFLCFIENGYNRNLKPIVIAVIATILITIVTTSYGNIIYPLASRTLATGMNGETAMYNTYRMFNIGSFDFVYNLLIPLYLLPYIYHNKILPRYIVLLLYALVIYCILQTQFTIALLIALPSLVLLFTKSFIYSKDVYKYLILFGVIIFLLMEVAPVFLNWLADLVDDELISERLNDIASMISGGGENVGLDATERQDHYQMSIDYFIGNPILGTLGSNSGGHSFVLDTLAKYGLIGLICLICMLRSIYNLYIKPFKIFGLYGFLLFAFFFYLVLLVLNPAELFISITFVLPLLSYTITNLKDKI